MRTRWPITACVVGVAGVAAILALVRLRWTASADGDLSAAEADASVAARLEPLAIRPSTPPLLSLPEAEVARLRRQIRPLSEGMTASSLFHVLHVHGLDARLDDGKLKTGRDIVRLFTDDALGKAFFGKPPMVRTRTGIRSNPLCVALGGAEKHRDQLLASVAEVGLPLSLPVQIDGETFALRELLRDSIANFHLQQEEIPWTAIAYTLYLPPQRAWLNKLGERTTFDALAEAVIAVPPHKSSCAGAHLVFALIALVRVDEEQHPILSPESRSRVRSRLAEMVREAQASQAADGSWGVDWCRGLLPAKDRQRWSADPGDQRLRLLATGHIAEWMMCLPEDLRVGDDCLRRAGLWLYARMKEVDERTVREAFCPCSHAVNVLEWLSHGVGAAAADQPRSRRHGTGPHFPTVREKETEL